jgi:hypothetical protein
MKTKIASLLTVALLFTGTAFAQDFAFKVLASKGSVKNKSTDLKIGSTLSANDQIIVGAGSYIGLSHKSGRTLELKEAGTYSIADLEKKVSGKSSTLATKYLAYVSSELTSESADINEERQNHMKKTGAVERAVLEPIDLRLPKSTKLLGDKAMITWCISSKFSSQYKASEIQSYRVVVQDMFSNVLINQDVKGNSFVIDFSNDMIKNQQAIIYFVEAKYGDQTIKSSVQSISKVDKKDAKQISTELESFGDEDTAISKVVKAQYLEEKFLYSDALKAYNEAIQLAPEVESFQKLYSSFLDRIPAAVE